MREKVFAAISVLIGFILALAIGEIACRMLPVSEGLSAMPVNAAAPVFHFAPNRDATWSRDWNFSIVNKVRVNNAGYLNDQDYSAGDPRPLLAVVGDSYVEAAMVPYPSGGPASASSFRLTDTGTALPIGLRQRR